MTHQSHRRFARTVLFAAIAAAPMLAAAPAWSAGGNEMMKIDCFAKPNDESCKKTTAATDQTPTAAPAATTTPAPTQPAASERPDRGAKLK